MPVIRPVDEYVKGLRDLADAIERNSDVTRDYLGVNDFDFSVWCDSGDEIVAICRRLGGIWRKQTDSAYFELVRRFGPHRISVWASRGSVCERVQVGTVTVERPDPEAEVPTITVEEPVYEFVCPDSLLEATGERDGGMSDDVRELDERRALQALRDEDLRRRQEHEQMLELDDQLEEQFACGDPAGDFDAAIERQEWGS